MTAASAAPLANSSHTYSNAAPSMAPCGVPSGKVTVAVSGTRPMSPSLMLCVAGTVAVTVGGARSVTVSVTTALTRRAVMRSPTRRRM